jgi:hypothetical protein
MNLGIVTNLDDPTKFKIYEGFQHAILDAEHNRVKVERETRVYHEKDTEVLEFDFEAMRLWVSEPVKGLCLSFKLVDVSPVSMMPRDHDQILISEALQSLWSKP